MSEKVWFVVENKHQVGPFTRSQIVEMINDGDLNATCEVREASSSQKASLYSVRDFSQFFTIPDIPSFDDVALPELPILPDLPETDELTPDLPPVEEDFFYEEAAVLQEEDLIPVPELAHVEKEDLKVVEKSVKERKQSKSALGASIRNIASNPVFLLVCATLIMTTLFYTFYLAQSFRPNLLGPKNITVSKMKLMQEVANTPVEEDKVLFALTRDKNSIWLATGLNDAHDLSAHFISVDNRILSESRVEFSSDTKTFGPYAEFRKMIFEKGVEIVPGEYDVTLTINSSGLLSKILNKQKGGVSTKKLRVLLHPKESEDYERDLKNYKDRQKEVNVRPLRDRLEKYRTLLSMIQKTNVSYFKFLEKALNGQSITDFEKEYVNTISPLFQSIVLESNRKLLEYERVSHNDADSFRKLIEDYRAYGELVSDMVTMTANKKWLRKKTKQELEQLFRARVGELTQNTQAQITDLEFKINQF